MTDEQIIDTLKCCQDSLCTICSNMNCTDAILNLTLDLINRQKAEIERLKKNIDGLNIFTTNHMKVIRLQAIKEFAERLKETAYSYSDISGYRSTVVDADNIDDLVKEMTE